LTAFLTNFALLPQQLSTTTAHPSSLPRLFANERLILAAFEFNLICQKQ